MTNALIRALRALSAVQDCAADTTRERCLPLSKQHNALAVHADHLKADAPARWLHHRIAIPRERID
eukprot:3746368-Pleurochrysis_carterae.AAC.1